MIKYNTFEVQVDQKHQIYPLVPNFIATGDHERWTGDQELGPNLLPICEITYSEARSFLGPGCLQAFERQTALVLSESMRLTF